ncbi:Uncharacterised protein [Staphylococcus aureus]|nr:Uncharacterised protein [Staphylococcus aureus]
MMFNQINNKNELEESYESEKKRIENELQNLNELRHRTRKENERSVNSGLKMLFYGGLKMSFFSGLRLSYI